VRVRVHGGPLQFNRFWITSLKTGNRFVILVLEENLVEFGQYCAYFVLSVR
jgi:hypothetical protein